MGFFTMKKLLLLLAVTMMAISTGLSLEPTRVSVYAPQYQAGTPATSVRVDLVNYDGGALTLYTGNTFTAGDPEVTADDNGVITVNVGTANVTKQNEWDAIEAANMNTFWTFDVYINGALFSQGRVDQQVIIQANTSIFNTNGVLVPTSDPSYIGDDGQRHDALFVKEIDNTAPIANRGVFVGPADGLGADDALTAGDEVLAIRYDDVNNEGEISVDGVDMMVITDTDVNLQGKILDNVAEINDGNQPLEISGAFTATQDANVIGATPGTDATKLNIVGVKTAQPVLNLNEYELVIDGDAKMGYLEVDGFSLTGDFNMNDNTIYNVEEIIGNSNDGTLLLNSTASANPAWVNNGPITTGTGQFTINGNLDATAGVDVTGGDLTVEDANSNLAFEVDVTTNTPNSIINLGHNSDDEINFDGWVDTDIIPTNNNDLGQDSDRWRSIYLDESLHIGPDDGASNDTELEVFYNSNTANFQVNDPTGSQFSIDATTGSEVTTFDPAGEGFGNVFIAEDGLHVDTDGILSGTVLSLTQSTVGRNSANTETLGLVNGGAGVLDVTIDGKLDVQSAASTMGDAADATQLTIEGDVAGTNDALVVQGSTDIDARLNVDGNTTLNANVDLGDAVTDEIAANGRFTTSLVPMTDGTLDLGILGNRWQNLQLSNNANVGNRLKVDGNTILGDADTDNIQVNGEFVSNLVPDEAQNALTLGTDAKRWQAAYIMGNSVHVGPEGGTAGNTELNIGYAANVGSLTVNAATNAQLTIDATAAAEVVSINPLGANANNVLEVRSNGLTIDTDDNSTSTDLIITDATVERNDATVETLTFINTDAGVGNVLNIDLEGKIDVQSAASTIGDGTDAAQLTVEGVISPDNAMIYDFALQGDADIDGSLNVEGFTTLGTNSLDSVIINGDIGSHLLPTYDNNWSIGSSAGDKWRNLWLANNANVGNDLQVDDAANVDGNTTLNGNVNLGDDLVTDLTTFNSKVNSSIQPNGAATAFTLGTDAERWADLYVLGSSVHIGEANGAGAGAAELNIGYNTDVATFNVDNATTAQVTIDAASSQINFDAAGDGDTDVFIEEGFLTINSGNPNLIISDNTLQRNDAADQVLSFENNGSATAILSLQVDGRINVQSAASIMGDSDDATQLTVEGDVAGTNDALVVQGSTDIDARLNVDGNTTLNGNVNLGDAAADEVTVTGRIHSDLIPSATADNRDIGSATREWRSGFFSNNMNVGNNANIGANARIDGDMRLNDDDQSNYVGFTSPAVVATNVVWTLPAADGSADQQLITDGNGVLSWGSTSLQVAYDGGQTINTALNGTNADIVITGNNDLDLQVPLKNTSGGNAVEVADALDVSGNITLDPGAGAVFSVNTSGNGVLQGNLDVEQGVDISGANLTMSDNTPSTTFRVQPSGNTLIEGTLTVNSAADMTQGLDVTNQNFTVGGNNFIVNNSGDLDMTGQLGLSNSTAVASGKNVLFLAADVNVASFPNSYPAGSVVHIAFTSGTHDINGTSNGTASGVRGGIVTKDTNGDWYIIGTF